MIVDYTNICKHSVVSSKIHAMSKTIIVKSPIAGYEIVDFGAGRVLERYSNPG
jgi:hypothetical protein